MRVLLDSHFVLWLAADHSQLSRAEREFVARNDVELVIPTAALWELRLKWDSLDRDGRRKLDIDPRDILAVHQGLSTAMAELEPDTAVAPLIHPIAHKDPFDILLLVQAQQMGVKLLSRDEKLVGHPLVVTPT